MNNNRIYFAGVLRNSKVVKLFYIFHTVKTPIFEFRRVGLLAV
jgi:hypothetical protein